MIVSNWSNIGIALCAVAVVHVLLSMFFSSKRNHLRGKHVLITGGSKGLGLALAREFLPRGCNVTVVARNQTDLLEGLQNLDAYAKSLSLTPKLQALRADTTSTEELAAAFSAAEASAGPIQVLFANAGLSIPGLFVEQPLSDFEKQVEVNYLGVVRAIKCVLPGMLTRRDGYVVVTASMAAVLGMAGYTSYAPTKWALRGLADCLHNELQGTGVKVSVAYPPDTDTPGYATEELTKPGLCKAVNSALGSSLFSAEKIAKCIVGQMERGRYHITTPDVGCNMLVSTMASLAPKSVPLLMGIVVAPVMQVVTSIFAMMSDRTARKYNLKNGYPDSQ